MGNAVVGAVGAVVAAGVGVATETTEVNGVVREVKAVRMVEVEVAVKTPVNMTTTLRRSVNCNYCEDQ